MRTIPTNVSRSSLAIIPSRCWVSIRSKHLHPLTLNVLLCTWSWIVWINTQCSSTVIEFQIQWQCTSIKLCSYNFWTAFIQFYPSVALLFAPLTSPPACQTWQSGCLSGVLSARLSYRSVERPTCFLSTSTSTKKKKTPEAGSLCPPPVCRSSTVTWLSVCPFYPWLYVFLLTAT